MRNLLRPFGGVVQAQPWRTSLAFKFVVIGVLFLTLTLLSLSWTLWITWNLEGGAAAVNEAGRLRMQTYRLALSHVDTEPGFEVDRQKNQKRMTEQMQDALQLLRRGDASRPLFVPWNAKISKKFQSVESKWLRLQQTWQASPPDKVQIEQQVQSLVEEIDVLVALMEQRLTVWTAQLNIAQALLVVIALIAAAVLVYIAYIDILDPIARLQSGLLAVQQSHFSMRVDLPGSNEFSQLAQGFNHMAQTLGDLYANLARKVAEKTHSLELQRANLQVLYDASALVSEAKDLESLSAGFAQRLQSISGVQACMIYTLTNDRKSRHMIASSPVLEGPLVGMQSSETPVLLLPLRTQQMVLGEAQLWLSRAPLDAEAQTLAEALVQHLATGMENIRAQALQREDAVGAERTLLARELHDSIAQSLAFLKIQTQLLRDAYKRDDRTGLEYVMGEIDTGVQESYADVRELLVYFRTRTQEQDITSALQITLAKFEHQTGMRPTLEMVGQGILLDADVQIQVLHIIQEALSNIRKHAKATKVHIRVQQSPEWCIKINDDGMGFDTAQLPEHTHVGLHIMRERAQRIGAKVEVQSSLGIGTQVLLCLTS